MFAVIYCVKLKQNAMASVVTYLATFRDEAMRPLLGTVDYTQRLGSDGYCSTARGACGEF